jgi:DNA-binding MarR family transcriptional regulator
VHQRGAGAVRELSERPRVVTLGLDRAVVLAVLSRVPDHILWMSEVATLTEGSLPRLSQVVARLEQRGWVRRTPDPADGRYTLAILTDEGRTKLAEAAPGHVEEVRRLVFDPLTRAQSKQLGEIGRRIMRAIYPGRRLPC